MGTMQRRHRNLREAMRVEGEPVPSLLVAHRMGCSRWVVACGKAGAAAVKLMGAINAARNAVAMAKRAALGLPPHETITITGLATEDRAAEVDRLVQALKGASFDGFEVVDH